MVAEANGKPIPPPDPVAAMTAALAEPFPPTSVLWRPADFKTTRTTDNVLQTMAVPYLDARAIQDRLDAVFGPNNWFPRYVVMPGGEVECQLSVRFPGSPEWIMKPDVGKSIDNDDDNGVKASYTDALKRAAVVYGIGRYLYRVGRIWAACAKSDRNMWLTEVPTLPGWAVPEEYRVSGEALAGQVLAGFGELAALSGGNRDTMIGEAVKALGYDDKTPLARVERRHARRLLDTLKKRKEAVPLPTESPQTGPELADRLAAYDERMSKANQCKPGDLVGYVVKCGVQAALPSDLKEYKKNSEIRAAVGWAKEFIDRHTPKPAKPAPAERNPEPAGATQGGYDW